MYCLSTVPTQYFEVNRMDDSLLRKAGWQPPLLLKLKAADGKTDLYGLMYLPSQLDKTKNILLSAMCIPVPKMTRFRNHSHLTIMVTNRWLSLAL